MAIAQTVDVIETALWPQGDARDPLGVWGARLGITGDATGGSIKVGMVVPQDKTGKYIYTCYDINTAQLTGAFTPTSAKFRLLTGWPNIDPLLGVQAYGAFRVYSFNGAALFTAPVVGISNEQPFSSPMRFLLLFDPRANAGQLTIVELELALNLDLATYSFEAYGYYWDRQVLDTPGGPRHPGSS